MTKPRPQEFEELLEVHRRILYKICRSYCKDSQDRDDLAQEITVQLWRSFDSFDGRCKFSTWMYRIALNVAISFWRRESVRARHVVSGVEQLLETAADTSGGREEVAMLYAFIEGLDALNKALILLYLDGNSHREIADVLGISETNVATKIGRLKQSMRQEFEQTERRKKS